MTPKQLRPWTFQISHNEGLHFVMGNRAMKIAFLPIPGNFLALPLPKDCGIWHTACKRHTARALSTNLSLAETGRRGALYERNWFQQGDDRKKESSMQKPLSSFLALLTAMAAVAPLAGYADSTNASAKVTLQTSYVNVVGPVSSSTGGAGPIATDWQTVLEQNIKMANSHDLLLNAAFEVGLYTATTVSSKNMITDTATATASVKVRALVDGVEAAPGQVVYGKRTQQLSATLEGAIANCLSIVTNSAGSPQIILDTNCVLPEVIGLIQDTVSANSFTFAAPNLAAGYHNVRIQAQISAMGDNQNGTFTATAVLGKGTMTAESVRLAKDPPFGYILPLQ
jgi:hypothetical protein